MIQKSIIYEVLKKNREEIANQKVIHRDFDFVEEASYALVGVRRSGKSYLLYQLIQGFLKKGISWDEMLYINFEDERLLGMTTEDLNSILEVHYTMSDKKPTLFLDEIQNIPYWEKFVRRLADTKHKLFITGSNAKMLSSEIATTLGGRLIIKEVFPYSFTEYLKARKCKIDNDSLLITNKRAEIKRHFKEYFTSGGFPECANYPSKRDYLSSVYQKIYLGDIASRNNIENRYALRLMFKKIAESVCQPISFNRLTNILKSTGTKISVSSIINYIEYSTAAFLLFPIRNIADNLTERETNPKYYFVDNGILSLLMMDSDSLLLENLTAVYLLRKYGTDQNVFFYNHNVEIDFYIPDEGLAIQVSYDISQSSDTYDRETKAFVQFSKYIDCKRCLLLTYDTEDTIIRDGVTIDILPFWKWALQLGI